MQEIPEPRVMRPAAGGETESRGRPARRSRAARLSPGLVLLAWVLGACVFDDSGLAPPDTDDASVPPSCGNGRLDPAEACDGSDLGGASCTSVGYVEGTLFCTPACRLDLSQCGRCGNEALEPGEECDGEDHGALTCLEVAGKPQGTLTCSLSCTLQTDLCHHCGDGVLEPAEDCDGAVPSGAACESLGLDGGLLGCLPSCTFDTGGCFVCGDDRCDYAFGESSASCPVDCARWTAVTAGARHTCGVRATGQLFCWGDNGQGQLGVPPPPWTSGLPLGMTAPTAVLVPGAGAQHGCAIASDGLLSCWGENAQGQLGLGTTSPTEPPAQVPGIASITHVAGGHWHTCAGTTLGTPTCWGLNGNGQLGDDSRTTRHSPTPVLGLSALLGLDAGSAHTCAVAAPQGAFCWGQGGQGQLGLGDWVDALVPTAVPGLGEAVAIATGLYHTCAARSDGTLACWGQGSSGQLGTGQYGTQNSPQAVPPLPGGGARQLAAGRAHTCVLLHDGSVHCTGTNGAGQLGDGSYTPRPDFAIVPGLSGVNALAAGDDHTCALEEGGALWCWGQGNSGQLGEGEVLNRNQPILVEEPL